MSVKQLWQTLLGEVELSVSRYNYLTWFKNAELLSYDDGRITIATANVFVKNQMEKKFTPLIKEVLEKNRVQVDTITYRIQQISRNKAGAEKATDLETLAASRQSSALSAQAAPARESTTLSSKPGFPLNPHYTFDTFIVGSSNDVAYTACQSVASAPGKKYNPLFLYGGVGIGKTHLVQAVGNYILSKNPRARVVYISCETFVNEFVDSLRLKRPGFSERYRNVDVLIVDDIQFIAGKEKTQDEFFHTFNDLHQASKQIIINADRHPKSIPTLTDRLRSRFEWGMAIDLQTPDFETRCAILQTKAEGNGFKLDRATVEYLANNIPNNIRELEGALNKLLAFCEVRGMQPDLDTASGLLGSTKASRPHHLTVKQVIDRTAKHFQVETGDIVSAKRDKHIVVPRQIAMYLLRSELHMSFPKIANELGRKDHTTAIHSVEKIEREIKLDYVVKQQVSEIREKLYA